MPRRSERAADLVRGMLYGVQPTAMPTMGAVVALLALATDAATWLPARRAARLDPARTLRTE